MNTLKNTWQGIKHIININNKAGPQTSQLFYNGMQINTNEGMANTFQGILYRNWIKKFHSQVAVKFT